MIPAKINIWTSARRLMRGCKILSLQYGYWRSIRTQTPVSAQGLPLPWYTYPCIEYLKSFDASEFDVFEFGAGNSSLYWAARARSVTSVEHDADWRASVASKAFSNQKILHCPTEQDYVGALASSARKFHVIVVDGKWRLQCVRQALAHVVPGGLILLDNSDRFPHACGVLRSAGFFQVDFSGPGPINPYFWTTSIFIRAESALQEHFMDPSPTGGLGICSE